MSKLEAVALRFHEHSSGPRRCACGGIVGPTGECDACKQKRLQRSGNGACEDEAARISERITRSSASSADVVPRLSASAPASPAAKATAQAAVCSGGHKLDPSTRLLLETRLGHDFSRVRVRNDASAAKSARELGALAYTVGSDIVFGEEQYAPSTRAGRHLLAHELVHVVQQSRGPAVVQRQVAPTTRTATDADRRDFARATIEFFNSSAQFYADPLVRVDGALFERVINSWYVMVTDRETMIDTSLGGDRTLKADLHAAYRAAIQVLMRRAAAVLGQSETDLYTRNTARIPMWAWPTPHHLEPGTSTPIEEGRSADVLTGEVQFMTNGFSVSIDPDTTDRSLGDRAETRIDLRWVLPGYQWQPQGGHRRITSFTPPAAPTVHIQTFFGPSVTAAGRSGYGRGTTPEDVAGGRVTPRSTSLGFHEGSHGLAFVQFLESNPVPRFTGTVGMTEAQFIAARSQWQTDLRDYSARIKRFSELAVDCVGTTIDQFERARAAAGVAIRVVCGP
jgi:Domain of unknown function (DUF4157)